jgi:hypothetical protein
MASLSSSSNDVSPSSSGGRLAHLLVSAKGIRNRKVVSVTRAIYKGKMKLFYKWLDSQEELKEASIDEETQKIILPLPVETVEMFFADLVVKQQGTEDIRETLEAGGLCLYMLLS